MEKTALDSDSGHSPVHEEKLYAISTDFEDPDAHLSDEERARIVSYDWNRSTHA